MTAKVIPINDRRRSADIRIKIAREEGFGMAIKAMMDVIMASDGPFSRHELQLAMLLLRPKEEA